MLHWIVQNNLYEERGYDVLTETIERFDLQHTYVKVVPFSHELIPKPVVDGPTIVMGSITLGKVATKRDWKPGAFTNKNFNYAVYQQHLGEHILNQGPVCRFGDVPDEFERFFIRPCDDHKTFAGFVTTWLDFVDWRERVLELHETYTTLDENTMVTYGPPKELYWEGRFWVVHGEVVTHSQYKIGRRVTYDENVPPAALAFVKTMIELWQPAEAFCIDVADTAEGYRVVEFGSLNSAGLYASNVQKLVLTLEERFG